MPDLAGLKGGRNLAMKVPPHLFEATVCFYRDVAGLPVIPELAAFSGLRVWRQSALD